MRWTVPFIVVAAVLLLLVGVPRYVHAVLPELPVEIAILDKTVPFDTRLEHRSFYWLLDHLKIVHRDGERYDTDVRRAGAFPAAIPGDPPRLVRDLSLADVAGADLVYLIDTYGVYEGDLESGEARRAALERSRRIYGGLTADEARAVERALDTGRTVIAEFNTLASPTPPSVRRRMERLLGVRWTRWIGRRFAALDDPREVPRWLVRNWEREWERPWRFSGPGYVLLQDDARVEVLRVGREARAVGLTIDRIDPAGTVLESARDVVAYPYWFDVVEAAPSARVLARYRWHLTAEGRGRLRARGLPEVFPAVVSRAHARGATSYYFAGDFADNPMPDPEVPLAGYPTFRRWFESARLVPHQDAFYWRFYAPMMTALIHDAAHRR